MDFQVELDEQHLERLGATAPITGLIELIWNSFDADAAEVRVELIRNDLDGIEEIRVIDDGHGMTQQEAVDGFGRLGGSWKKEASGSKGGRALHGRDGRGRFSAAGLGGRLRWKSVSQDPDENSRRLETRIELSPGNLSKGEVTDPVETDDPVGTSVVIDSFTSEPKGLNGDGPIEKLTGTFGLYLQTHNAHLFFDDNQIEPDKLQANRSEYTITPAGGDDALLVVIEWNKRVERGLYLCDERGTPLGEVQAGIQAPNFEFTAYLNWTGFESDNNLDLADLGTGETKGVIELARDQLRNHFKERAKERSKEQIDTWKSEDVYPFQGSPTTKAEEVARDVFDVVALSASSVVNTSDKSGRKFSLRLLREALENDPGSLHKVLNEVLDLKPDHLEELSDLLEKAPLTALIATSREISNRLDFLKGLEELVLGDDSKHVKERSQLHRILANETWVFGEEFALAADDNSLTTVLKKHLRILGRDELAEDIKAEVLDDNGSRAIVDLMLARSLGQNRNRREHLVVELKAPKVKIGDDQASQIRRYADAVVGDARFNTNDVSWDFVIVSGEVSGMVDRERRGSNLPYGQITGADGVRIWVKTWADIIEDAEHRLKFVKGLLDYQPDAEEAIQYLRNTHAKYVPEAILSKDPRSTIDAPQATSSPDGST